MYEQLRGIAADIEQGQVAAARAGIGQVLQAVAQRDDPEALQAQIFVGAMAGTLDEEVAREANLYLRSFEVSQIHLFDLLASSVPLVSLAREIGNRMIIDHCRGHEAVVLIDIGIGSGTQEAELLQALAALPDAPQQVTVYGIEVSDESLAVAAQNLAAAVAGTGTRVELIRLAMAADDVSDAVWDEIAALPHQKVAMSSFAFHHIGNRDGQELRDAVLRRLRAVGVQAVVLTEPDSNHLQPSYGGRFEQAWRHFGATYSVLDALPIAPADRSAIKALFFGREVADILGTVEGERAERHEDSATWWRRLSAAGFVPDVRPAWTEGLSVPAIHARPLADHISIEYDGVGIVAVICACPG